MIKFYINRLQKKSTTEERQSYLDTTVPERFRDDVRTQWNEENPDEVLS